MPGRRGLQECLLLDRPLHGERADLPKMKKKPATSVPLAVHTLRSEECREKFQPASFAAPTL